MIFRFNEHDEQCVTGNLDILDEDVDRVSFSDVELFEGQAVEVRSDAQDFEFKGQFQGGVVIAGDLIQNNVTYQLDLEKANDPAQQVSLCEPTHPAKESGTGAVAPVPGDRPRFRSARGRRRRSALR
jgi:hypothetical protein